MSYKLSINEIHDYDYYYYQCLGCQQKNNVTGGGEIASVDGRNSTSSHTARELLEVASVMYDWSGCW